MQRASSNSNSSSMTNLEAVVVVTGLLLLKMSKLDRVARTTMESSNLYSLTYSHTDVVRLKTCVVIERTVMVYDFKGKTDCSTGVVMLLHIVTDVY
eukprot:5209-Heterococcus_DN1.PRE.2